MLLNVAVDKQPSARWAFECERIKTGYLLRNKNINKI